MKLGPFTCKNRLSSQMWSVCFESFLIFFYSPAVLSGVLFFFSEVRGVERESSWRRGDRDRDGGHVDGEGGEGGETRPWRPSQRWKSDR